MNNNQSKSIQNTLKLILIILTCVALSIITPSLTGIGDVPDVLLAFTGMYFTIIIPATSFMIPNNKIKIAFCLVNVAVSTFIAVSREFIIWPIVVWALLWGFISLLCSAVKVWYRRLKERISREPDSKVLKLADKYVLIYYPFINLILEILCFLTIVGFFNLFREILDDSDGWGILFMAIPVLIFFSLVIVPSISCRYAKKIKNLGKRKYLYCIYNSIIMASLGLLMVFPNILMGFINIYFHGILWPSLIAGLITVSCSNKNTAPANSDTETAVIEETATETNE